MDNGDNKDNEVQQEDKKVEQKDLKPEKPLDESEKNDENKLYCYFNGKNMAFDKKEICEKIKIENENKDSNVINIPVILYLNIMRIISNIDN